MTTEWYLGRCIYEPRPHTRLQPSAFSKDGKWQLYDGWSEFFPSEGRVFTNGQPGLKLDALFAFDVLAAADTSKQDKFRVATSRRAEEVLDYTKSDPEEARRALVERGISGRPAVREDVVVALPDSLCVRLTLVPDPGLKRSMAELLDLERLTTYDFDNSLFSGDKVEGRWYTVPDVTVGAERGTIDWSRDRDFMESLIRQLRKLATPDLGQLSFATTKAQIQAFLTTLDRQGLLPAKEADWRAINSRVWNLAFGLKGGLEKIDEIIEVLSSLSPVEEKLTKAFEARTKQLETEFTARIEAEVRETVENSFAAASQRNRLVEEQTAVIVESWVAMEKEVSDLSERKLLVSRELDARAADVALLIEDPKIARNSELGPVLASVLDVFRGQGYHMAEVEGAPPRSRLRNLDRSSPSVSWGGLNRGLETAAELHGFKAHDLVAFDIVARAGQTVLLPSEAANSVLECYSSVVSHGRFLSQSLDPSVLGYDDLWRSPSTDSPTPLSRAWAASARDRSAIELVLIEGIERTPLDLWVGPLIRTLESNDRPPNLLVFLSMGGTVLDPARGCPDLPKITVPFNPSRNPGPTGNMMARLMGTGPETTWLDFAERKKPTSSEASQILQRAISLEPAERLEVAARLCEAARGSGIADLDATIGAIWRQLNGHEKPGATSGFAAGREFIQKFVN
jgi:hypothetical protein